MENKGRQNKQQTLTLTTNTVECKFKFTKQNKEGYHTKIKDTDYGGAILYIHKFKYIR